jgi:hypothetical protein
MRFAFTPDQREFFRKHRYIEFQGLLSSSQAELLDKKAEDLLARRLNLPPAKWDTAPPHSLYKAGYDLWREDEAIKKITQKLSIAHIAAELFDTTPLRIAFDQLCMINNIQSPPFSTALSVEHVSSVKPLAGVALFLLKDLVQESPSFPLPTKAGNALFFAPDIALPWKELYSIPGLHFLLLAFAPIKSYYRPEPNDPHSPAFKKLGYVYNEQLKEELHPVVFGKK